MIDEHTSQRIVTKKAEFGVDRHKIAVESELGYRKSVLRRHFRSGRSGMNPLRILPKEQSGVIAIVFALLLPVLIGMLGVIIDLGYAYQYKRIMQTAADGAAMGGAFYIFRGDDNDEIETVALYDAGLNGFDGSNGETITVNDPPEGGFYAGQDGYVEVIISQQLPTYFMPVLGISDMTISARAVAGVTGGVGCVWVLNGTANDALLVSSGSSLTAKKCYVRVASCDGNALEVESGSSISADDIDVCGGYNCSGDSTCVPTPDTGECDGAPCERGLDPLADLEQPVPPAGCDQTDFLLSSQGSEGDRYPIWPGTYCNGISIESGSHVNFNPGVYYLKGGGLNILSDSSAEGEGYDYRPFLIDSNSVIQFAAPNSDGIFDKMLFWQDRDVVASASYSINKIHSNATSYFEGIFYMPTQKLFFHSNTVIENVGDYTVVVVDTMEITSGTHVGFTGGLYGGIPVPTLVE